jgi:signal transduction histidine kinase
VWYRPVGCIVIEKKDIDDNFYLNTVQNILSIKKHLVDYIKNEFHHGVIQEAIMRKFLLQGEREKAKKILKELEITLQTSENQLDGKRKELNKLNEALEDISHTYKDYIGIKSNIKKLENNPKFNCEQIVDIVKKYTMGLQYIFRMGSLINCEIGRRCESICLQNLLNNGKGFRNHIEDFLESSPQLIDKCEAQYILEVEIKDNFCVNADSRKDVEAVLFEFVFNAVKQNIKPKSEDAVIIKFLVYNREVYIANTGREVPESIREKIFEKTISRKAYDEENRAGSGIGLYNIKYFLNNHGIEIELLKKTPQELEGYSVVFKLTRET